MTTVVMWNKKSKCENSVLISRHNPMTFDILLNSKLLLLV